MREKRISILGMARSGTAAAVLVKQHGGIPFVSEMKPAEKVAAEIEILERNNIEFETGGHTDRALRDVDFFIVSPGIPPTAPFMRKLQQSNLPMFSEIEVSSWLCAATLIAITGTNGKSTTTALVAHLLNTAGRRAVATGNIGSPFAHDVRGLTSDDYAVVETSSYQLERIEVFKPKVAAILNITPDHLDRYGDMQKYAEAKCRIADAQDSSDFIVLNADDAILQTAKFWGTPKFVYFSTKREVEQGVFVKDDELVYRLGDRSGMICRTSDLGIPGPHNVANCAAAAAMVLCLGLEAPDTARGLKSFKGIVHRIEFVAEINGVRYINDSKATNVDSVYVALQSVPQQMYLIMGGRDKGSDYTTLLPLMRGKVKKILLIGEAANIIENQLSGQIPMEHCGDLSSAIMLASQLAQPGEVVMLSPACASFDQFRDFEDRGDKFKEAVMRLQGGQE